MKRARVQNGCVVFNKKYGSWNFLWFEEGRRKFRLIGTISDYKTKEAASRAAEGMRQHLNEPQPGNLPTVASLVRGFRLEKMPERFGTRLGYNCWFDNHILPAVGSWDDLCQPGEARPAACLLPLGAAHVSKSGISRGNRETGNAFAPPQLPFLARCCGNSDCGATEAHAALGHSHYAEHLRGCGHERDG